MTVQGNARRHLDVRLAPFRALAQEPPPRGWIRAVRDALGMSSTELASRMGISQSRIPEIERGEVAGSLKVDTLERAAHALDCEVVYALVPRTSLEESVRAQARRTAEARLAGIRHNMRLEDQGAASSDTDDLVAQLADDLVDRRGLWADSAR